MRNMKNQSSKKVESDLELKKNDNFKTSKCTVPKCSLTLESKVYAVS